MFRFAIRDVLWLTVVVALALALWKERTQRREERLALIRERDAAVENERRIGRLLAIEAVQNATRRNSPAQPLPLRVDSHRAWPVNVKALPLNATGASVKIKVQPLPAPRWSDENPTTIEPLSK